MTLTPDTNCSGPTGGDRYSAEILGIELQDPSKSLQRVFTTEEPNITR